MDNGRYITYHLCRYPGPSKYRWNPLWWTGFKWHTWWDNDNYNEEIDCNVYSDDEFDDWNIIVSEL